MKLAAVRKMKFNNRTWAGVDNDSPRQVLMVVGRAGAEQLFLNEVLGQIGSMLNDLKDKVDRPLLMKIEVFVADSLTEAMDVGLMLGAGLANSYLAESHEAWLQEAVSRCGLLQYSPPCYWDPGMGRIKVEEKSG